MTSGVRAATLLLLLAGPPVRAGYVVTAAGRLDGKIALAKDHVAVDGKKVAWDEVLYLLPGAAGSTSPQRQHVRFRNGEVWACELLTATGKELEVKSGLLGRRKVDLGSVAALEFVPEPPPVRDPKPATLYRAKGEPIPGELLSLTGEKLGIASPLGDLELPRAGLARYIVSTDPPAPRGQQEMNEVSLVDGSVLLGRLKPLAEGFALEHGVLGRLTVPAPSLRSLVRHSATLIDLADQVPKVAETTPLLAPGPQPVRFETVRGDGFIKGLRIEPKTVVRYALPRDGKKRSLRAMVSGIDRAKGDARVRVRVGKVVLDQEVAAEERPRAIDVDLPEGEELVLEVDFGRRLRFLCGVVLADPHLLVKEP